jgi:hypothetical protein
LQYRRVEQFDVIEMMQKIIAELSVHKILHCLSIDEIHHAIDMFKFFLSVHEIFYTEKGKEEVRFGL